MQIYAFFLNLATFLPLSAKNVRMLTRFYRHLCLKNVTEGEDFISEFGFRISELFVKGQRSEDKGQGSGGLKSKVKGQRSKDNGQWTISGQLAVFSGQLLVYSKTNKHFHILTT